MAFFVQNISLLHIHFFFSLHLFFFGIFLQDLQFFQVFQLIQLFALTQFIQLDIKKYILLTLLAYYKKHQIAVENHGYTVMVVLANHRKDEESGIHFLLFSKIFHEN